MDDANRSLRLLTIYSGLLNGKVLRKKELADKYGTSVQSSGIFPISSVFLRKTLSRTEK